ncbi:hypothetical protein A0U87_03765 [Sphingobium sp. MP9-4]|nr:hypothetical protein BV87_02215 [Sphingobium yanoikuyae]TKV42413.1 hypothetical protein A0U87_03765 [Sphingobium sp. MP9-4]
MVARLLADLRQVGAGGWPRDDQAPLPRLRRDSEATGKGQRRDSVAWAAAVEAGKGAAFHRSMWNRKGESRKAMGLLPTKCGCKILPCKGRGTTKWWRGVALSRGRYPSVWPSASHLPLQGRMV